MRLSRDDILKAEDLTTEEVDVPEWGGTVLVRGLTGRERDEFEASVMVRYAGEMVQDLANIRAKTHLPVRHRRRRAAPVHRRRRDRAR